MIVPEDLRGRHFMWDAAESGVAIVEDPVIVGQIARLAERPSYLAEFAGLRLTIEHSVGVLGPAFEVKDTSTREVRARSHYTREGEMRAVLETREYALRRSGAVAVWGDGTGDAVSIRSGEAFVMIDADPRDAATLLTLGIVMALENSLFPAPKVRGF